MNHFLSITEILLEPITEWNIPNVVTLPRISRDIWLRGPAPDGPELGWRLVTRVCSSPRCQHEPSGGTGAWSQAGDGGGAARYQARIPGPGHTSSRKEESELCPRLPGHHRVTILGWSWGQRRGCEITDISDVQSPIITRGQVTGPMVSATRGETRLGTISDQMFNV